MDTKSFLKFFATLIFSTLIFNNCNEVTTKPENRSPQIQNFSSNPITSATSRLIAGEIITFQVTAIDPDEDLLSYSWECTGGAFTEGQNTNTVTWQSPITQSLADYNIKVRVSDGQLITDKTQTSFVAEATPGINITPLNLNFGSDKDTMQIKLFNIGGGALNWQIENLANWTTAIPSSGNLSSPSDTAVIKFIVNRESLSSGNYNQTIDFINSNNPNNVVSANITMVVPIYGFVEGHTFYSGTIIPISDVSVNIDNKYTTTNLEGYYRLNNINTGNKVLNATKNGFDQFQYNINISQNLNIKDIPMTSSVYTHSIYGTIVSATTQDPVQNVNITLLNDDGSQSLLQTTSEQSGYYHLDLVPEGNRQIKLQRQNFLTLTKQILVENSNYQLNIQMINKPGVPLNPIPPNNSIDQSYPLNMGWSCDGLGSSLVFDVYLGTTNPPTHVISQNKPDTTMIWAGLSMNTEYFWKVVAKDNENNVTESPVWKFTTIAGGTMGVACPGITTVEYAGKIYNTIKIGNQCWLKENLDIGTMLNLGEYPSDNNVIEKHCFDNNPLNCDGLGGYYSWTEAMQYTTNEGAQGICPTGWHIPTLAEFENLRTEVNNNGNSLKEIGQGIENGVGTNTTGFSALLAGYAYRGDGGHFEHIGFYTYLWSSSIFGSGYNYFFQILTWVPDTGVGYYHEIEGLNIRCIKD